ncbi:MAG: aminodeoxychorismate/anthranilate synthase component II [Alicyclobacillus sp.]|nr:aminodeoxychorismate/anthranilate synthase component II [Alicyclobacillus sp.]
MRVLLILDNFDSFTYNLVQYCAELGAEVHVLRNTATLAELQAVRPEALIVSPGPCTPNEAGVSLDAIRYFAGRIPVLGVCLGHQALGQAFGGRVVRAPVLMHGKTSWIYHTDDALFQGIPNPFSATRYHSLVVAADSLPDAFTVTAECDGLIMGLRHRPTGAVGVQFHPESILTPWGKVLLANFLGLDASGLIASIEPSSLAAGVPNLALQEGVR